MSLLRRISGKVILVISGQGRMMYQSLEPKPEGAISSKRSKPQGRDSSPHDAGASMANWLETNIQGTKYRRSGSDRGTGLAAWPLWLRQRPDRRGRFLGSSWSTAWPVHPRRTIPRPSATPRGVRLGVPVRFVIEAGSPGSKAEFQTTVARKTRLVTPDSLRIFWAWSGSIMVGTRCPALLPSSQGLNRPIVEHFLADAGTPVPHAIRPHFPTWPGARFLASKDRWPGSKSRHNFFQKALTLRSA